MFIPAMSQVSQADQNATVIKRLVELVDDKQKENVCLKAKTNPFNKIIYEAATSGYKGLKITVYFDSACTRPMSLNDIQEKGKHMDTITMYPNPDDPDYAVDTVVIDFFQASYIDRYLIITDSLRDKSGLPSYQMIAIAPLYRTTLAGVLLYEKPVFWAKWSDLKDLLSKIPFASSLNMDGRLSYYDFFMRHLYIAEPFDPDVIIDE